MTEVVETKYLDIVVKGNTKYQLVKYSEYIQYTLLNSGVRERYIDIISYDAVSVYYHILSNQKDLKNVKLCSIM